MKLFQGDTLRDVLAKCLADALSHVEQMPNDVIMGNATQLLCDNIYEQFKILPVEILEEDFSQRKFTQTKIEKRLSVIEPWSGQRSYVVDAADLKCYFPYRGSNVLLRCRIPYDFSPYPDVTINESCIVIEHKYDFQDIKKEGWKESVNRDLANDLAAIKKGLDKVNNEVSLFDVELKNKIESAIVKKKEKIDFFYKAAKLIDVSVEKNEYGKRFIPVVRRVLPLARKVTQEETNYCISNANYEEIMEVIKHTLATMERTPYSYRHMGEEDLRNVLLASLNGLYQGTATGEAFREGGKTDICIEEKKRAAFVAECKMWGGENEVESAFEQLAGYLTWRDSKTALLFFVRRKDFMAILNKMESKLQSIEILSRVKKINENEFECCMASTSSVGQIVMVRVLLANMYYREDA